MGVNSAETVYGAIDVGAGSGSKVGVFSGREIAGRGRQPLGEALLPVGQYGGSPESLADGLLETLAGLLERLNVQRDGLRAVGVSCAGLFRSDGSAIVVSNMRFLWDANLPELLRERLRVPVRFANDADAGALAEWSLLHEELLYWVLGGGWGGAWVSADGEVRHASLDWDGDDASLHYTNEPGYAIPLGKDMLRELFAREGASFDRLEEICIEEPCFEELRRDRGELTGPSGRRDCVRAELLVSGPGRWRMFRALSGGDRDFARYLSAKEASDLEDPATAGEVISRLNELDVDAAVRTDRLFGLVLAEAAGVLFDQAARDGCPGGIPIYLAGGPSRALGLFGPSAADAMRAKGITSELRPSRLEKEGRNANLLGAAVLAASSGRPEAPTDRAGDTRKVSSQ